MFLYTAVASKNAKVTISIGTEMLECFRQKKPLPVLVEMNRTDDEYIRRTKRIIRNMTRVKNQFTVKFGRSFSNKRLYRI